LAAGAVDARHRAAQSYGSDGTPALTRRARALGTDGSTSAVKRCRCIGSEIAGATQIARVLQALGLASATMSPCSA
jgi:hypothetical protein